MAYHYKIFENLCNLLITGCSNSLIGKTIDVAGEQLQGKEITKGLSKAFRKEAPFNSVAQKALAICFNSRVILKRNATASVMPIFPGNPARIKILSPMPFRKCEPEIRE